MARMACKCGTILSNSETPNDIQLRVYLDREWDAILEKDTIETWKIPLPAYDVWKCPTCGRIYVFSDSSGNATKVYRLEETS